MSKPRKIAFFGSDEIALPAINSILSFPKIWEICAVLTQPDRRSGRGRKLQPNAIKQWAIESNTPVKDPQRPGHAEVDWLESLQVEMVLIMAYGHILDEALLNVPKYGSFNLHASLLPQYRGASPIETALAMGEEKTGVTLMQVVPKMDAGPILDSEVVLIEKTDVGTKLRQKLADACVPLLARSLPLMFSSEVPLHPQVEKDATYCRKLTKLDGQLNFLLSAVELENRTRAFSGWPGSYFFYHDILLRVGKIAVVEGGSLLPGQRDSQKEKSLIIGTGDGAIEILELQKPGGKMLAVSDFLRGFLLPKEIVFSSPAQSSPLIR